MAVSAPNLAAVDRQRIASARPHDGGGRLYGYRGATTMPMTTTTTTKAMAHMVRKYGKITGSFGIAGRLCNKIEYSTRNRPAVAKSASFGPSEADSGQVNAIWPHFFGIVSWRWCNFNELCNHFEIYSEGCFIFPGNWKSLESYRLVVTQSADVLS